MAYRLYAGKSFYRKNFNFGIPSSLSYGMFSLLKLAEKPIYLEGEVLDHDEIFVFQDWISSLEGSRSDTLRRWILSIGWLRIFNFCFFIIFVGFLNLRVLGILHESFISYLTRKPDLYKMPQHYNSYLLLAQNNEISSYLLSGIYIV